MNFILDERFDCVKCSGSVNQACELNFGTPVACSEDEVSTTF